MTTRLTRKQQQALTRSTLLVSAARVLAEKGLYRASIDEIAADGGFTKGAFYANFESKEQLFLALLDEHFAERLASIERLTAGAGEIPEQAERVGQDFLQAVRGDEEWCRLFLEFTYHATRHESFRREFVARNDALRDGITAIYARRAAEAGIVLSVSPRLIAQMTFAMAHGVAVDQLLDGDSPDELFGTMLRLFFAGLVADSTPVGAAA